MAEDTDVSRSSKRVSSVQRIIEERLANSLFRSLLCTRFHWPVSNWLVLLSYAGRQSGRQYTFPVAYEQIDDAIVVVTPIKDSNWWKNFRDPSDCTIWFRGTKRSATGEIITTEARDAMIVEYFERHGIVGWILGFGGNPATGGDQLDRAKQNLAVIRFTFEEIVLTCGT